MAKLRVYLNGQMISDFELRSGTQYTAGRSETCELHLEAERGVSRQHFKLYDVDGSWKVETLSRYGEVYFQGDKAKTFELHDQAKFSVPPYEFQFIAEDAVVEQEQYNEFASVSKQPVFEQPVELEPKEPSLESDFDRTYVGQAPQAIPYLKVLNMNGDTVAFFQLEGRSWIAGRDTTCSLFLDNPKISRQQFEIQRQEGVFVIKDLGSVNGTQVNGKTISATSWEHLDSGDVITIVDWTCHFELRDPHFEDRFQAVPEEIRHQFAMEAVSESAGFYPPSSHPPLVMPFPYPVPPIEQPQFQEKKPMWIRYLMIGLVVVGAGFYFMDSGSAPRQVASTQSRNPFDKLPDQQKQYVKDSYRLAESLFKQGRYELARQEVAKVHQLVPYYENSKDLEKLAEVAIQTKIDQQKAADRERAQQEIEDKIQAQIKICKPLLNKNVVMSKLDDCLTPVLSLNPDHPQILSMKAEADRLISDREIAAANKADYLRRVRTQKGLYSRAQGLYKTGEPLKAISAYENVVGSGLPDPEGLKGRARRQIASIRDELNRKQEALQVQADKSAQKGDLKTAVESLKAAIKIDPENESIKGRLNTLMGELRSQMRALYQEGILEESVGEVETAKTKWKKILSSSVPEEEYYKKAKIKLRKYGVE